MDHLKSTSHEQPRVATAFSTSAENSVTMAHHRDGNVLAGVLSGVAAAIIWGAFPVITRMSLQDSAIDFLDITFLRVTISGIVLLPVLLYTGLRRIRWHAVAIMVIGVGAPYMLVVSVGLTGAPADQFAAVTPGSMICFSLLLGALWLRLPIRKSTASGIALIILGIAFVAAESFHTGVGSATDYLFFIVGGFMWASYTAAAKKYQVEALHAASLVAVFSMVAYAPVYLYFKGAHIASVDTRSLLVYGIYQGIFASIVALFFYNKAIKHLGSTLGATFAAMIPGLSAVIEPFLLDERPTAVTLVGLAVITIGMLMAIVGSGRSKISAQKVPAER